MIRFDIKKIKQMQESELLHLLQLNFNFSYDFAKISDSNNKLNYLLFNIPTNKNILFDWCESGNFKTSDSSQKKVFYFTLLKKITGNLFELHQHLLKPNLNLIRPELIVFCENHSTIKEIQWLVLPSDLHVGIPVSLIKQKSGNLWNYISANKAELKNIVMSHYQLVVEDRYKEAGDLLDNYFEYKSLNNYYVDFEQKAEKTNRKTKTKGKTIINNNSKSSKNKKSYKDSEFIKYPKSRRKTKANNNSFVKRIINRLKNINRYKKSVPSETTVPINPQDDLFRLAMLSEGPPGTLAESKGIRAFVLVDEFLIGRDKMICDLVLTQSTIGRVHARISRHGSHYFLEDLGSANGTTLDEKKLNKHQTYLLPDQCRLKFAEQTFYFHVE